MQTLVKLLLSCSILFLSFGAHSAPPQTLDYQGYLANSGGVPLTGSVNVSVSLYTAASGGAALWTQASSPTLSNGRFAVVLDGSGGNAFPAAVFDQPLFVGLTVDTDPEMTPRQPLTSVPSAFEAMNADTVDGLHSNEIIDAASDEVRTPISSLPFTISASGSYYLTQNLMAITGGINVNVDNVTIDLMGFTLDGNGVNDFGIYLNAQSAVVIKNGTIREFGRAGVYNGNTSSGINVVTDVQVIANGSLGSSSSYSGIYLAGSSNRVERCIAKSNGGYGIYANANSIIKDNVVEGSQGVYGIYAGSGSVITNNVASSNWAWGIYVPSSSAVIGNTVRSNNTALTANRGGLYVGISVLVEKNIAQGNYENGIYVSGTDNILRNNHAARSLVGVNFGGNCFYFASSDNAAIGNTATGCTDEFAGSLPTASRYIDNIGW